MRKASIAAALLLMGATFSWAGWTDFFRRLETLSAPKARRSHSTTAVAAVRGWSAEEAAKDNTRRDEKALKRLESVKITPEELETFIKAGRLAP